MSEKGHEVERFSRINGLTASVQLKMKEWVDLLVLLGGAIPLMGILLLLQYQFAGTGNPAEPILFSASSIAIAFVIFPVAYLKKQYKVRWEEIGIRKSGWQKNVFRIAITAGFALLLSTRYQDLSLLRLVLLQNIAVAIGEEVLFRGAVIYVLSRIFKGDILPHLLSALLFVFVLHSGAGFVENILFRLPITIVIGLLYRKTQDLGDTIAVHWLYNLFASSL